MRGEFDPRGWSKRIAKSDPRAKMIGMGDMQLESSTTSDVCGRVDVQEPRGSKKANGNLQNASPAFPVPTAQPARHTENRTPSMPQTLSGVLRRTAAEPEAPTALEALAALELRIMQPPAELSCENPECSQYLRVDAIEGAAADLLLARVQAAL